MNTHYWFISATCMVLMTSMVQTATSTVTTQQVTYTRIQTSTKDLPKDKAFVASMLTERIGERTQLQGRGKTLKVSFRIDPSLEEDEAVIDISKGRAVVRGGRFRTVVAGTGQLLRALRYQEHSVVLRDGRQTYHPANHFRQAYLSRHFDNFFHRAPAKDILRYIDDLALWGINGIHTMLQYPEVDADHATPADLDSFKTTSDQIVEHVHALDLILTVTGGSNTAPSDMPKEYHANKNIPRRGADEYNVCPEKPGALDYLLSLRKEAVQKFADKKIDGFVYWPYDEGGCTCEECRPWGGKGYVKLIEKYRNIHEEYYPHCTHLVSTWFFDDDDWKLFYDYLFRQDWIDYLIVDAHNDFPRFPLEHPIPKNIKIITFPEISMWGRRPWGGFGAIAMPERFERLFRQAQPVACGFQLYSEGIFEDLNKIVVNGLYTTPASHADDILEKYAHYEFPGCDTEDFKEFIRLLEATHWTRQAPNTHHSYVVNYLKNTSDEELAARARLADKALVLAEKIDKSILPSMRKSWRWRIFKLRAVIDHEIFNNRNLYTPAAIEAYRELVRIYHAEEQQRGLAKGYGGHTCPPLLPEYKREPQN